MRKLVTLILCLTSSVTFTNAQYWCSTFVGSVSDFNVITTGGTVPEGTPCCFPFKFGINTYHSCTSFMHGRLWCSVESVYDGNWGNCVDNAAATPTPGEPRSAFQCSPSSRSSFQFVTTGGTVPEGTPCCFPFVYNDVAYSGCTSAGHSRPWCPVESVYNRNTKRWGNCVAVASPTSIPGGPTPIARPDYPCAAPSSKSNVWYTVGGNALQGTPCCFPFTFRGTSYSTCTLAEHKQPWCPVSETFESNGVWGNCMRPVSPTAAPAPPSGVFPCNIFLNSAKSSNRVTTGGTLPEQTPCCFPFVFNEVLYSECTSAGHSRPWCPGDSIYRASSNIWGNCIAMEAPVTAAPPAAPFQCVDGSAASTMFLTTGGTVPEDSPCCFPFSYKRRTFFNCITVEHNQEWCSVDSTFNGRWGNCKSSSTT